MDLPNVNPGDLVKAADINKISDAVRLVGDGSSGTVNNGTDVLRFGPGETYSNGYMVSAAYEYAVYVASTTQSLITSFSNHASRHAAGGSDPITPTSIGAVASNDSRLTNQRSPTAHRLSHAAGGSDQITPASIGAVPESRFLTGTGFPEGVVAAPPGTEYTDTAGTNGAWRWLKMTGTGNTGWRVIYGDTGWRDVSEWLDPAIWEYNVGAVPRPGLIWRMTQDGITLIFGAKNISGVDQNVVLPVEEGMRPATINKALERQYGFGLAANVAGFVDWNWYMKHLGRPCFYLTPGAKIGQTARGQITYEPQPAYIWPPGALPGTPITR